MLAISTTYGCLLSKWGMHLEVSKWRLFCPSSSPLWPHKTEKSIWGFVLCKDVFSGPTVQGNIFLDKPVFQNYTGKRMLLVAAAGSYRIVRVGKDLWGSACPKPKEGVLKGTFTGRSLCGIHCLVTACSWPFHLDKFMHLSPHSWAIIGKLPVVLVQAPLFVTTLPKVTPMYSSPWVSFPGVTYKLETHRQNRLQYWLNIR